MSCVYVCIEFQKSLALSPVLPFGESLAKRHLSTLSAKELQAKEVRQGYPKSQWEVTKPFINLKHQDTKHLAY